MGIKFSRLVKSKTTLKIVGKEKMLVTSIFACFQKAVFLGLKVGIVRERVKLPPNSMDHNTQTACLIIHKQHGS